MQIEIVNNTAKVNNFTFSLINEVVELRLYLALHHECSKEHLMASNDGIYCSKCILDFENDSIDKIIKKLNKKRG